MITITIPEVPVQEPSTPPNNAVSFTATEGASEAVVALPQFTNDGNVTKTLRVTLSNLTNCTVNKIAMTVGLVETFQNNVMTYEREVQPGKGVKATVTFGVTPQNPGQGSSQATADYLYEWV